METTKEEQKILVEQALSVSPLWLLTPTEIKDGVVTTTTFAKRIFTCVDEEKESLMHEKIKIYNTLVETLQKKQTDEKTPITIGDMSAVYIKMCEMLEKILALHREACVDCKEKIWLVHLTVSRELIPLMNWLRIVKKIK